MNQIKLFHLGQSYASSESTLEVDFIFPKKNQNYIFWTPGRSAKYELTGDHPKSILFK